MPESVVVHSTFVIERSYGAPPERVFDAFADPAKKKLWLAASDKTAIEALESDFRVGGVDRIQYRFGPESPFPGAPLTSEGHYLEIVPDKRVVTASNMAIAGRIFSASLVTFEMLQTANGTDLVCTFQGAFFEGADGPAMREEGWNALLDRLGDTLIA